MSNQGSPLECLLKRYKQKACNYKMQGMQGNCNNAEILLITVQHIQETEFGADAGRHTDPDFTVTNCLWR